MFFFPCPAPGGRGHGTELVAGRPRRSRRTVAWDRFRSRKAYGRHRRRTIVGRQHTLPRSDRRGGPNGHDHVEIAMNGLCRLIYLREVACRTIGNPRSHHLSRGVQPRRTICMKPVVPPCPGARRGSWAPRRPSGFLRASPCRLARPPRPARTCFQGTRNKPESRNISTQRTSIPRSATAHSGSWSARRTAFGPVPCPETLLHEALLAGARQVCGEWESTSRANQTSSWVPQGPKASPAICCRNVGRAWLTRPLDPSKRSVRLRPKKGQLGFARMHLTALLAKKKQLNRRGVVCPAACFAVNGAPIHCSCAALLRGLPPNE